MPAGTGQSEPDVTQIRELEERLDNFRIQVSDDLTIRGSAWDGYAFNCPSCPEITALAPAACPPIGAPTTWYFQINYSGNCSGGCTDSYSGELDNSGTFTSWTRRDPCEDPLAPCVTQECCLVVVSMETGPTVLCGSGPQNIGAQFRLYYNAGHWFVRFLGGVLGNSCDGANADTCADAICNEVDISSPITGSTSCSSTYVGVTVDFLLVLA